MASHITDARRQRNIVAARTRFRDVADPGSVAARTRLDEESFVAAVTRALAAAPPIRAGARNQVIALLSTSGGSNAVGSQPR